jgi:hypothetical protein
MPALQFPTKHTFNADHVDANLSTTELTREEDGEQHIIPGLIYANNKPPVIAPTGQDIDQKGKDARQGSIHYRSSFIDNTDLEAVSFSIFGKPENSCYNTCDLTLTNCHYRITNKRKVSVIEPKDQAWDKAKWRFIVRNLQKASLHLLDCFLDQHNLGHNRIDVAKNALFNGLKSISFNKDGFTGVFVVHTRTTKKEKLFGPITKKVKVEVVNNVKTNCCDTKAKEIANNILSAANDGKDTPSSEYKLAFTTVKV